MVLGSGVDSIPSDLVVRLALETLRPAEGAAVSLRGVYTEYSGSFSGGASRDEGGRVGGGGKGGWLRCLRCLR